MRQGRPRSLMSAVAIAAFSALVAACGGGSPGVASIHSSTTPVQTGAVAYAACMRSHGVSDFPDPDSSGTFAADQLKSLTTGKSQLRAATSACAHLLPGGLAGLVSAPQQSARQKAAQLAAELSFARCMRRRGVSRFPDPSAQGSLSLAMVEAGGIDVHSPAVLRVVRACLPASHGWLTPARVAEALHNAH
jgi:hypothetical protein